MAQTATAISAAGAGGGGGSSQNLACENLIVRDGDTWIHSFADATLLDLRIDGSTITFAGRGRGNVQGGVPGLTGGGQHFFVGQVARAGCDISIKDLGVDYDGADGLRLSQGSDSIQVVWTRGANLCAASYDALGAPAESGCPEGASVVCTIDTARFETPAIAKAGSGTAISFYSDATGASVTCNGRDHTIGVPGTRVFLTATNGFKNFGRRIHHVRMATLSTGDVQMTGLCPVDGVVPDEGNTPAACGAAGDEGFKLIGAYLDLDGKLAVAEPKSMFLQPEGSEATVVPSQKGFAFVHMDDIQGSRFLGWGVSTDVADGEIVWPAGARIFLESASAPSSASAQILAGQSHGRIGQKVPCPSNGCVPFAFWIVDGNQNAIPYGRGYGTSTGMGETSANAAAISDDRVIVGGRFQNGALLIDNLASRVDAGADHAFFLANVPNAAP